jgi:hypothetical protein
MPPKRVQVIPLDVLLSAAQNSKNGHRMAAASQKRTPGAGSRRKVAATTNGTGKTVRQAKTEGKPQKVIQPVTALLYQSALAMQQEQAEAKRLQKAKPQQIIQPVTALQFMAALAKQLEQAEANQQKQPVAKQSSTNQQKQPAIKQQEQSTAKPVRKRKPAVTHSPPPQIPPAKPTRKRKPAVRKPIVQPLPVIPQTPPHQRTPPMWWRLWSQFRAKGGALERWHWCLGFSLSASLAGIILWLCSSNLHGLILFLVVPGFVYPISLLSQNTRKYQAVETLIGNYIAIGITALGFTFYTSSS